MSHSTQPIISLPNFHTYFSKSVLGYYYQSNHNRDWRVRTVGKMFALHMAKSGSTPGIPNVSRNSPGVIRVCRARSNPDDFWVWPKNKQAERVLITTSGWGYPSQMVFCLNELLITPNPFLHCCYWGFFFCLDIWFGGRGHIWLYLQLTHDSVPRNHFDDAQELYVVPRTVQLHARHVF